MVDDVAGLAHRAELGAHGLVDRVVLVGRQGGSVFKQRHQHHVRVRVHALVADADFELVHAGDKALARIEQRLEPRVSPQRGEEEGSFDAKDAAGPLPVRTGASASSARFPLITLFVFAMRFKSPIRTLPEGSTTDARFTAAITSEI